MIFGAIDGFSRKVMFFCFFQSLIHYLSCELLHKCPTSLQIFYLDTAGNNRAETAFGFFMDGVRKNGWPSRQAH